MSNKLKTTALICSLVLNLGGAVVLICFLKLQSSYHAVVRENEKLQQNFAAAQSGALPAETVGSLHVSKRTFISHLDGSEDFYAVLPPSAARLDNILVVYLHGMGSNYMEPFIYPSGESIATAIAKRYANVCVLSCNYRKEASWGTDAALADISQNIRELQQQYPIEKIVLIGTSMGGCTVLNYAATAPADIRAKICGVVSVEGAGDLAALCATTQAPPVKAAIEYALGGTAAAVPAAYAGKSFLSNIGGLQKNVRTAIVSARLDTVVPPQLQDQLVAELERHGYPVKRIDVQAQHGAPPADIYVKGLEFAVGP